MAKMTKDVNMGERLQASTVKKSKMFAIFLNGRLYQSQYSGKVLWDRKEDGIISLKYHSPWSRGLQQIAKNDWYLNEEAYKERGKSEFGWRKSFFNKMWDACVRDGTVEVVQVPLEHLQSLSSRRV